MTTTRENSKRIEVSGGWPALTLTLSPGEREQERLPFEPLNRTRFADQLTIILPLPGERAGVRAEVRTDSEFQSSQDGVYNECLF
jgi:hypothetical protein